MICRGWLNQTSARCGVLSCAANDCTEDISHSGFLIRLQQIIDVNRIIETGYD
jgi:hypothetical protein